MASRTRHEELEGSTMRLFVGPGEGTLRQLDPKPLCVPYCFLSVSAQSGQNDWDKELACCVAVTLVAGGFVLLPVLQVRRC